MDNNSDSTPTQNGGVLASYGHVNGDANGGDWRSQLLPESRHRIVNKITETIKRHHPNSGEEELHEFKLIAETLEEKVYTVATSQSDYLRQISLKMLVME